MIPDPSVTMADRIADALLKNWRVVLACCGMLFFAGSVFLISTAIRSMFSERTDSVANALQADESKRSSEPSEEELFLVEQLSLSEAEKRFVYPGPSFNVPKLSPATFKLGQFGYVSDWVKLQIISDSEALAKTRLTTFFLKDFSTHGMIDDKLYDISDKKIEIVGTVKYETAIGSSKTVFVAKVLDEAKLAKIADKVRRRQSK